MAGLGKKTVEDINVKGKKCIVRCDFNVPMSDGVITDDKRIREALKTVKYLKENGAKIILCSHMGRPKGEFNMKYSLAPVAERISELMGCPVAMATDVIGEDAKAKAAALGEGEILLLENLLFHKEEEKNAPEFAKALAVHTLPQQVSLTTSLQFAVTLSRKKSTLWAKLSTTLQDHLLLSLAVLK